MERLDFKLHNLLFSANELDPLSGETLKNIKKTKEHKY